MQIQHAGLQPGQVEFRGYQANLARIASNQDTLVVLPTGMGKTIVALLVLADALQAGAKRILLLAPTKPLVEQHARFLGGHLAPPWNERVHALTGHVPPDRRASVFAEEGIVCATPQVVQNDLVTGRAAADAWDWVVFDEAHRAVGEYPYAFIGQAVRRARPGTRRLGLTASPGHDVRRINEVRQHLGLSHVEIRTPHDPDVAPYLQELAVEWETMSLPEHLARVSRHLHDALAERVRALKQQGALKTGPRRPNRKTLLEAGQRLQAMVRGSASASPDVFAALSVQAQAMKLLHAIELAETQGSHAFMEFVESMREETRTGAPSKATRRLVNDRSVQAAYEVARHGGSENPKLARTKGLVHDQLLENPDSRVIVFANFRTTCELIASELAGIDGVRPVVFVGHGRRKGREGLTQKQQQETLQAFRDGTHNCLVATSVAEEGLDIPDTDLVVFYEPIPSEIRSIQRRGRTGRHRRGHVVVLMTKGTQDEAAHWTARRREQQMVRELQSLRGMLAARPGSRTPPRATPQPDPPPPAPSPATQATLPAGPAPAPHQGSGLARLPRIVCDHREQSGGVVRHLHELGTALEARSLDVGDFVLSDRVVVERKKGRDFVDSLVDGRLFEQVRALQAYPRPLLVLEGEVYGHRSVAPEALAGALASLAVDMGVTILQTGDALATARLLHAVAKREQFRESRRLAVRPGRQSMADEDRLLHILAGFPLVDEVRARALLTHFGSLEAVFAAPEDELAKVAGVGDSIAGEMRRLLTFALLTAEPDLPRGA